MLVVLFLAIAQPALAAAPTLSAVSLSPLKVRGVHFQPRERVTVRLRSEGVARSSVVRATKAGAFAVVFRGFSAERCTVYVVTARGDLGSKASLRSKPFVDCAQP